MTDTALPVLRLITDHLDRQVVDRPNQEFLVLDQTRLTYAETQQLVDRMAKALIAAGVSKGDRVAMMSNPTPEFFMHFLAVSSIGAIWMGLNPKYTSGEIDHVVGNAEPRLLFAFAGVSDDLSRLMEAHSTIEQLVLLDNADIGTPVDTFLEQAAQVSDEDLAARRQTVDPLDPAFLVYTSGTTGRPKGALLTHRGYNFCSVMGVERKGLAQRRIICNLPINHVGSVADICGRVLIGGGTVFFQERFSPSAMMELIEREQLDAIGGVPTMLQLCAADPTFDNVDLSSVDLIAWGGAAIPADLLQTLLEKTGATQCTISFGMTETTGSVTYSGLTDSVELLSTTVGTPDPRQPLRIWHSDDREAAADEPGEIQVLGDYTMAGYWRNPEATAAAFTADGWMRTGDLGVLRADGYVQIVGRMSEMFKSGGYNVYPREIELALEEHAAVSMAAVVSIPDPTFQEVGIAYVMGPDKAQVDVDELRAFAAERLANYKVPKQIVVLESLPMLPIGKVDKPALKARGNNP